MAQAPLKIKKKDIIEMFLVTEKYGENAWQWRNKTMAACTITFTDKDGGKRVHHVVYDSRGQHTETKLIQFLKNDDGVKSASTIMIKVYQNYSPCKVCAKEIRKYINSTEVKAEITITFANFYLTHAYSYKKGDGSQVEYPPEKAKANIEGLRKLNKCNGVNLKLFGVNLEWKTFLGMSQFFSLNEEDKKKCLDRAGSYERKDREKQDKKFWEENIISSGVDEITSEVGELGLSDD